MWVVLGEAFLLLPPHLVANQNLGAVNDNKKWTIGYDLGCHGAAIATI